MRLTGALAPTLSADLDGDGREETVTASPGRGGVRLAVRDAGGRRADAKAPSPESDVVRVALSAGSLGSAGALLFVEAASDAGDCVSAWRLRGAALDRVPIRGASGKESPDCGPAGAWTWEWKSPGEGRPAELVRERSETTPRGVFRVREAFAFAGFSLDPDPSLSSREIAGMPIPAWYDAVLYGNGALETLYARYDLSRLRGETTLHIVADRERGVFAIRFTSPAGDLEAPVTAFEPRERGATVEARFGDRTMRLRVHLGGADGTVPIEVEAQGLGPPYDQLYGPAGSYHGRAAMVFPDFSDELASQELASTWIDPKGGQTTFALEGNRPYRISIEKDLYDLDFARAEKPVDVVLAPEQAGKRAWGILLRGRNVIERVPLACPSERASPCRPDGPPERLRRLGARANAP